MAASSESGGVFPVGVLGFPCFHPSPLRWDLPPAWLWAQLLWLSPLSEPVGASGSPWCLGRSWAQQDNVPIQPCLGLDPAHLLLPALPLLLSAGDGCMDWAVPFLNPPPACTVVWWGTVQHPHWCLEPSCAPGSRVWE